MYSKTEMLNKKYMNKDLDLEKPGILYFFISIFLVPILNNLPKGFNKYIKKTNKQAEEVIDNATNHKALEILYKKGQEKRKPRLMSRFFRSVWFNLANSKAVRNRLKIVISEMHGHLEKIAKKDRDINILNIASGSARAIIEVAESSEYLKGTKLSITFLDKDVKAIEYSKDLSKNISHFNLNWVNDTVGNFMKNNQHLANTFDIIEIVGLFDYFSDEKLIDTMSGIYNLLSDGGIMITANINHNKEEKFITDVIEWPMVYRDVNHLANLANKSGFSFDKMKYFYEPFKVHGLVIAKK
jgi:hypothetical protein